MANDPRVMRIAPMMYIHFMKVFVMYILKFRKSSKLILLPHHFVVLKTI